jgi:hypothetical protein
VRKTRNIEHRKLSTLLFRYENSLLVREILTEGVFDATAVNQTLLEHGNKLITALPVDYIDVDFEDYDTALERNNKGKLLYIAQKLCAIAGIEKRVVCLADADTNSFQGMSPYCPIVVYTDYADLGMHFINEAATTELLELNFSQNAQVAKEALTLAMTAAMHELAARAVMEEREFRQAIPPSANYLDHVNDPVTFDESGFLSSLTSVGLKPSRIKALVSDAKASVLPSPCFVNSHDLCEVLLKLFKLVSAKAQRVRRDELEDRFFLLRQHCDFSGSGAFSALLSRLAG